MTLETRIAMFMEPSDFTHRYKMAQSNTRKQQLIQQARKWLDAEGFEQFKTDAGIKLRVMK